MFFEPGRTKANARRGILPLCNVYAEIWRLGQEHGEWVKYPFPPLGDDDDRVLGLQLSRAGQKLTQLKVIPNWQHSSGLKLKPTPQRRDEQSEE